jgi:DMSO/TMAO reductase YedYZ heme-binding membrane subunit
MTDLLLATSTVNLATQRVTASWPWYVIRAAGFVSAGLLMLLIISGIGQATGITYRYIEPIKAWAIHKAMALSLCVTIAIHGGFLLIDHYVRFSLIQVLVPFESHYSNGTKLLGMPLGAVAVTLGILAMYGVAIIVATSLGWIESRKKTWRLLHYLGYLVVFFIFLHALYVGTDLRYGVFRKAWIGLGVIILLAIIARLWRAGTIKIKGKQRATTPKETKPQES